MKQLTIHIPEKKFQFVLELLRNLDFIKIDTQPAEKFVISEKQKALVDEEFRKLEENPNYALDWEEVKHQLFAD
jgi:hypothetical protein